MHGYALRQAWGRSTVRFYRIQIEDIRVVGPMKRRAVVGAGVALAFIATAAFAFWLGDQHARTGIAVKRVTVSDVANAMKEDRFYSDNGKTALVMNGTISSVGTDGSDLIADFQTNSSFRVRCDLGPQSQVRPGDTITVVSRWR